jgi:hypothetical protein
VKSTELSGYIKATERAFEEMDLAINTAHALETKEGTIHIKRVRKTLHTWKPSQKDIPNIESQKKKAQDIIDTLKNPLESLFLRI